MGATRIPLRGTRRDGLRGLVIKSSDCDEFAPPKHVNDKHREIQRKIDRRKVDDGKTHGYIEHNGEEVTGWEIDDKLL